MVEEVEVSAEVVAEVVVVAVGAAEDAAEDEVVEDTHLMIQITQVIGSPVWVLIQMMNGTALAGNRSNRFMHYAMRIEAIIIRIMGRIIGKFSRLQTMEEISPLQIYHQHPVYKCHTLQHLDHQFLRIGVQLAMPSGEHNPDLMAIDYC